MSRPPRKGQSRRPQQKRPAPIDIWREPGALPEMEPITVPPEAGALLRSLGTQETRGRALSCGSLLLQYEETYGAGESHGQVKER